MCSYYVAYKRSNMHVHVLCTLGHVRLNDSMSDKEFEEWLRDKGMTQSGDRDKIIGVLSMIMIVYMFMC